MASVMFSVSPSTIALKVCEVKVCGTLPNIWVILDTTSDSSKRSRMFSQDAKELINREILKEETGSEEN